MKILTYGNDERVRECARLLEGARLPVPSLMLLPIPVTKDKKHINGTDLELSALKDEMESGMLVVGYGIPREVRLGAASEFCDVACDESFLRENARLTALGALGYILSTCDCAPQDLSIGVIGYGRIGSELVRELLFLGASVTVYTSKNETRVALGRLGVKTRSADYEKGSPELSDIDILINTAPARLIGEGDLPDLSGVRLIELASGDNFPSGAAVERLPSLPARLYPKSAGRAYYNSVMRMVGGAV